MKKTFFLFTLLVGLTSLGRVISAVNGQRFYTNNKWPNSVVLRIENAKFIAKPRAKTTQSAIDGAK